MAMEMIFLLSTTHAYNLVSHVCAKGKTSVSDSTPELGLGRLYSHFYIQEEIQGSIICFPLLAQLCIHNILGYHE